MAPELLRRGDGGEEYGVDVDLGVVASAVLDECSDVVDDRGVDGAVGGEDDGDAVLGFDAASGELGDGEAGLLGDAGSDVGAELRVEWEEERAVDAVAGLFDLVGDEGDGDDEAPGEQGDGGEADPERDGGVGDGGLEAEEAEGC